MKVLVNFKTPDVLDYALDSLNDDTRDKVKEDLAYWIKYQECVSIEFDTDKQTATVLPAS